VIMSNCEVLEVPICCVQMTEQEPVVGQGAPVSVHAVR
jgi:hypothetical protein